jgi:dihydrofolate reductase
MPESTHSSKPWKAIAAMAKNRVIGNAGSIPWHIPEDFKWVKQCTLGHTIVMGRKTYESMGRPLPKRRNVVLSRSAEPIPGCVVLSSLDEVSTLSEEGDIWIFGGAEIYRQAFPRVAELYLTVVDKEPEGDTFFPPFEDFFQAPEVIRSEPEYEIRHYRAKPTQ